MKKYLQTIRCDFYAVPFATVEFTIHQKRTFPKWNKFPKYSLALMNYPIFSGFGQNVLGITTKLESLHRGKNAPIQIPDESNIPWAPETFDSPICDSVPRNCNSRLTQNESKTAFLKNFHLFYSASENAERKNWFTCNWRQFRRYNSNPIQSQRRWCSWNDLASWWSSCSR